MAGVGARLVVRLEDPRRDSCQDCSNCLLDIPKDWYLALACVLCKATAIIETTYSMSRMWQNGCSQKHNAERQY